MNSRFFWRLNHNLRLRQRKRSRPLIGIMMILILALVGSTNIGTASAASNSEIRQQLANQIGGSSSNWSVIRDKYGNYVGAKFKSSGDRRLKGPKQGRLDTACGRIWSTDNNVRRITVTEATYWRKGARTNLTICALTAQMAANKYKTGDGSASCWHLIAGSENTGWSFEGCSARKIYVPFGHADHPYGRTGAGNWTPVVSKAGAWRWNT